MSSFYRGSVLGLPCAHDCCDSHLYPRGSPANLPLAFIYHPCLKTAPEDDRKRGTGAANLERVKEHSPP